MPPMHETGEYETEEYQSCELFLFFLSKSLHLGSLSWY